MVLSLERRDASAALASTAGYVMPSLVAFIGLIGIYKNQDDQTSDMQEVKDNVNGNFHRLTDELKKASELNRLVMALLTPEQVEQLGGIGGLQDDDEHNH